MGGGIFALKMVGGSWEVSPICTKLTVERWEVN